MTRLWSGGIVVQVWLNGDAELVRVRWQGQVHAIEQVANHWRIDVGWWRLRLWRDYYKILTTSGLLMIVYHDLVQDTWYLQRVYD